MNVKNAWGMALTCAFIVNLAVAIAAPGWHERWYIRYPLEIAIVFLVVRWSWERGYDKGCQHGFGMRRPGLTPPSDEMAWVILANVNGGDWDKQSPEWQEAATRWRDRYHESLRRR